MININMSVLSGSPVFLPLMMMMMMIIIIIIIIIIPKTRKYWVDVQRGIVSFHWERDPL